MNYRRYGKALDDIDFEANVEKQLRYIRRRNERRAKAKAERKEQGDVRKP